MYIEVPYTVCECQEQGEPAEPRSKIHICLIYVMHIYGQVAGFQVRSTITQIEIICVLCVPLFAATE